MAGLFDKRLLIVTGKGGVGKSTVAAGLALACARAGQKTLVCELSVQERISRLLDGPQIGPEIGEIEENLWAVNIRFEDAMREYALMTLKFQSVYRAVFENRLVRYFLRFLPSLQELVVLGKILFHEREQLPSGAPRFDKIVLDAPATGHAITFLSVPQVILETVPAGPLYSQASLMRQALVDPAITAAVLVSLPEDLPVNETLELDEALRTRVGIVPKAVILNSFVSTRFSDDDLAALAPHPALAALARSRHERERASAEAYRRLDGQLALPVHCVPRLFVDRFGRNAIAQVADHLRPALEGRP